MRTPYRDDEGALRGRLRSLVEQREAARAMAHELRALAQDEAALDEEIAALHRELGRRAGKRPLLLDPEGGRRQRRRAVICALGGGLVVAGTLLTQRRSPPPLPPTASATAAATEAPLVLAATSALTAAPATAAADAELSKRLRAGAFDPYRLGRRALYTWTTSEQVAEMARTGVLLSRARSPSKGDAFFDVQIRRGPAIGRIFAEPALARRRFAWLNPWATANGANPGETYGDRLVRVTLKREAWVGAFGEGGGWSFSDLEGHHVAEAEVLRHPERIAAVLHVHVGQPVETSYREYVLCNESMIEAWSVDAPEVATAIPESIELLHLLLVAVERDPGGVGAPRRTPTSWSRPEGDALADLYEANLAFSEANPAYALRPEAIRGLIAKLTAPRPHGPPIRRRIDVPFPGFREGAFATGPSETASPDGGLPSVKPAGWAHAVKCVPQGTFGCAPLGTP